MEVLIQARDCRRFDKKTVGLFNTKFDTPIFFETRTGIHTFFMKAPIFVVIIDEDSIVQKAEEVRPNKVFLWNPKYKGVLEIPNSPEYLADLTVGSKVDLRLIS